MDNEEIIEIIKTLGYRKPNNSQLKFIMDNYETTAKAFPEIK